MPTMLDETYEPRLWRCEECRRILGVVMRDTHRIRRLWVFRMDRCDDEVPATSILRQAPRGLYIVRGMDQSQGVECPRCGAITEWSMSQESFDRLMVHFRKVYA